LDQVHDVGLALVSAGAGYGKTALLASWASQLEGIRLAWLTCREEHNDVRRLTDELVMALGTTVAIPLGALLSDVSAALDEVGETIVIVFDDVHHLTTEATLRAFTRFLQDRPDNVSLVVSGRDLSQLPWHRFSARGELIEVRSGDLAFTSEEAAELLATTFDIRLAPDAAERLCAASEGWAAGLCLAGHAIRSNAMRQPIDSERLSQHGYVQGFIDSEVLTGLSADEVRFLEDTSLLERLDPQLCDLMTGRSDSLQILRGFAARNLFTEEVATSPAVYRYHAVFADWLRSRASWMGREHVDGLLGVASGWYEERGETDLAIDAALRAGDTPRVESLIGAASGRAIRAGFAATVVRWVSALPPESIERRPELALLLARAAGASGDLIVAQAGIASVGKVLDDPSVVLPPSLRLEHRELTLLLQLWTGAFSQAQEGIEQALAFLEEHPQDPGYELFGLDRAHFEVLAALTRLLAGELDEAISRIAAILEPGRLVDPAQDKDTVLALGIRALALAWHGDREGEARRHVEACRSKFLSYRGTTGGPFAHYVAGTWCADADRASADLAAARSIALQVDLPIYAALYRLAEAKYALRKGWWDRAESAQMKAEAVFAEMPDAAFLQWLADDLRAELGVAPSSETSLTDRELAMLRALATGATRRQLAEQTYLSLNTVKTHLRTAYRKLGVNSRSDAIERARALGLLEGPNDGGRRPAVDSGRPRALPNRR
jgi:LuxR family maltose regulon positive regulatory protein